MGDKMLQSVKNLAYNTVLWGAASGAAIGLKVGIVGATHTCASFFGAASVQRLMGFFKEEDIDSYRNLVGAGQTCSNITLLYSTTFCAVVGAICGLIFGVFKERCGHQMQRDNIVQRQQSNFLMQNLNKIAKVASYTAAGYAIGNLYGSYNAIATCALSYMQHPAQYERCLNVVVTPPSNIGTITGACLGVAMVVALSMLKHRQMHAAAKQINSV